MVIQMKFYTMQDFRTADAQNINDYILALLHKQYFSSVRTRNALHGNIMQNIRR